MRSARLAINTQTPLVRFTKPVDVAPTDGPLPLTELTRGEDYRYTAGGVTHMLHPLLAEMRRLGKASSVVWVALNAETAPSLVFDGVRFEFVSLDEPDKAGYAEAKEGLWALLNSLKTAPPSPARISSNGWDALDLYHELCGTQIAQEHGRERLDLVYVHDFQQLGVAGHLPDRVPRVFHLHTPFPRGLSPDWNRFFTDQLSRYDTVIVSCEVYANALRQAGYRGRLRRVYPFVDPRSYPRASAAEVREFRERFEIPEGRRLILNVARMDPMKGQDRMLQALPALLRRIPDAHLVLVGNGSFSSSRKGGLGLNKGSAWRGELESLAQKLGVEANVTFTGHLAQKDMPAAYEACEAFCLPSLKEGFGLAVVEAWIYRKPVVVSRGAGVSEIIVDGENGILADVNDPATLTDAFARLLRNPEWAADLGNEGYRTSRVACLEAGLDAIDEVLTDTLEAGGVRA